jgi:hypothetical protein
MPKFLKSQGHSHRARAASFDAARVPGSNEWKTVIAGIAEPGGTGSTSQHLTTADSNSNALAGRGAPKWWRFWLARLRER